MNRVRKVANAVLVCRGKAALQHRDALTRVYPNFWGLFGGALGPEETAVQGMIREVSEELGISLTKVRPIGMCLERPSRLNERTAITVHVFCADITRLWPRRRLSEGQGCALFSWPAIEAMKNSITPMAFKILENHFGVGSHDLYTQAARP